MHKEGYKSDMSALKKKVAPPFHSLERSPVEFFAHQPRIRTTCSLHRQPPFDIYRSVDEWHISTALVHYGCSCHQWNQEDSTDDLLHRLMLYV